MKKALICLIIISGIFIYSAAAQADVLDEQVNFNIDSDYDYDNRSEITATLRASGDYIYFYVDNEYWNSLSDVQRSRFRNTLEDLVLEFDTNIYPKERAVFGSEWNPGIDNDPKITVLFLQLIDEAGGYINTYDEYQDLDGEAMGINPSFFQVNSLRKRYGGR